MTTDVTRIALTNKQMQMNLIQDRAAVLSYDCNVYIESYCRILGDSSTIKLN